MIDELCCRVWSGGRRTAAVSFVVGVGLACSHAFAEPGVALHAPPTAQLALTTVADAASGATVTLAPLELLALARQRCAQEVQGYSCVFLKRERWQGKLGPQQILQAYYRDEPLSVDLTWVHNADRVRRLVYVRGRNLTSDGQEQATIEPTGALARLFVGTIDLPIHGERARNAARYPVDQFGFRAVLDRLARENDEFAADGVMRWEHAGSGMIDARPTIVLIRHLPYTQTKSKYPDARLVVHLDQQRLWPVAIYSFADEQESVLLGSYITTHVQLNPTFDAGTFHF